MTDPATTEAARALSAKRWGSTRPVRLAHELLERAAELPPAERVALRNALVMADVVNGKEQR